MIVYIFRNRLSRGRQNKRLNYRCKKSLINCQNCFRKILFYLPQFIPVNMFLKLQILIFISCSVALKLNNKQNKRLKLIKTQCRGLPAKLNISMEDSIPNLLVDDKHGFLFCDIPKVASTNWKKFILRQNGIIDVPNVHDTPFIKKLRKYSPEEQKFRLGNYFKFMFVRDPLERLVSAFRNKIENNEIVWENKTKGSVTVDASFHVLNKRAENKTNAFSFSQFADILTSPEFKIKRLNVHWKQYYKLCHPCIVNYNFVGKLETFATDLAQVLGHLNFDPGVEFPAKLKKTNKAIVEKYMNNLSKTTARKINKMYRRDKFLFSYY